MIAGLRIVGDSNTVQIDSSFSTPNLVKTGLISPKVTPARDGVANAPFVDSGSNSSMLFIGNTSGAIVCVQPIIVNGFVRYRFFSSSAVTVRYYLYDNKPSILSSSSTFGLQIFKEDGSLYYDSGGGLLLINQIVPVPFDGQASASMVKPIAMLAAQVYCTLMTGPNNLAQASRGLIVSETAVSSEILPITPAFIPLGRDKRPGQSQIVLAKRPVV